MKIQENSSNPYSYHKTSYHNTTNHNSGQIYDITTSDPRDQKLTNSDRMRFPQGFTVTTKESTLNNQMLSNRLQEKKHFNMRIMDQITESNQFIGNRVEIRNLDHQMPKDMSSRSAIILNNSSSNSNVNSYRISAKPVPEQLESSSSRQMPNSGSANRSSTVPANQRQVVTSSSLELLGASNNYQLQSQERSKSHVLNNSRYKQNSNSHKILGADSRKISYKQIPSGHKPDNFQTFDINQSRNHSNVRSKERSTNSYTGNKITTQQSSLNVINGNQVIRVNASDPTSLINSGRQEVSESPRDSRNDDEEMDGQELDEDQNGRCMVEVGEQELSPIDQNRSSQMQHLRSEYQEYRHSGEGEIDTKLTESKQFNDTTEPEEGQDQQEIEMQDQSLVNLLGEVKEKEDNYVLEQEREIEELQRRQGRYQNYRTSAPGTMNGTGLLQNQYNSSLGYSSKIIQACMPGQRENPATMIPSPMYQESLNYTQSMPHEDERNTRNRGSMNHSSADYGGSNKDHNNSVQQRKQAISINRNYSFAPNTQSPTRREAFEQNQQQISVRRQDSQGHYPSDEQDVRQDQFQNKPPRQNHQQQHIQFQIQLNPTSSRTPLHMMPESRITSKNHLNVDSEFHEDSKASINQSAGKNDISGRSNQLFGNTHTLVREKSGDRINLGGSRSFSQGQFQTQTHNRFNNFPFADQDITSGNTLSAAGTNSMMPRGTGNSTSQQPVIVEILKQELISCKRQLKDQQASNQFLKKEKFKVEHEKNLMQIQLNQGVEKMEQVLADYENIQGQLEQERATFTEDTNRKDGYIEELERMNSLHEQTNQELNNQLSNMNVQYNQQIFELQNNLKYRDSKKLRNHEKVVSQIFQLKSAASHLKDMIKLSKVQDEKLFKENNEGLVEYLNCNIEATVVNTLRLLGENHLPTEESIDNQSSLEKTEIEGMFMESDKLKTRAQNFKRFRQTTNQLIQKLFDSQLHAKKLIIHDLENQLIKGQATHKRELHLKEEEITVLKADLDASKRRCEGMQKQLEQLRNETVPQVHELTEKLRDQESLLKQKYQREYMKKEEQLQSKMIKQKYQLQEEIEKCKMMSKQNTELKIQNEGMRYQIQSHEQLKQVNSKSQIGKSQTKLINVNSSESIETEQQLQFEKYKNKKLKEMTQKQEYYHAQEKSLLQNQIQEYKDTVEAQNLLIQQLQRRANATVQNTNTNTHSSKMSHNLPFHHHMHYHPDQENNSMLSNQQNLHLLVQPSNSNTNFNQSSSFKEDGNYHQYMQQQHPDSSYEMYFNKESTTHGGATIGTELEPIYEDGFNSKGEQSTARDIMYQNRRRHEDEDLTQSHTPQYSPDNQELQIQHLKRSQNQRNVQHALYQNHTRVSSTRPAHDEIRKVYESVNSTMNNLMRSRPTVSNQNQTSSGQQLPQSQQSTFNHYQNQQVVDDFIDSGAENEESEQQEMIQQETDQEEMETSGHDISGEDQNGRFGNHQDYQDNDEQQDEHHYVQGLNSPPNIYNQTSMTEEQKQHFANRYANLENINASNFKSLETDSQLKSSELNDEMNETVNKTKESNSYGFPSQQISVGFGQDLLKAQRVNTSQDEDILVNGNPIEQMEFLQKQINELESKLQMHQSSSNQTVIKVDDRTLNTSATVKNKKETGKIVNQQKHTLPQLELSSDNSQDSFNMNTLPLQSPGVRAINSTKSIRESSKSQSASLSSRRI